MHKTLPFDAPSKKPIEDKVLGDHVFDILEHSRQTKEFKRGGTKG